VVLGLPILPDPASGVVEVRGHCHVLLLSLDLCLHPASGVAPLLHGLFSFFVSPLVGQLFVAVVEPDLLKLLLVHLTSRIVELVV